MSIELEYEKTLEYLYGFVDHSLSKTFHLQPINFELERMFQLMDLLGNPQNSYPIIHVAGTKGKGSVTAMCASVLNKSGLNVGMYTSPHLFDYTERINVNGIAITKEELINLVNLMKPSIDRVPELTMFEITTAMGMLHFSMKRVDSVVLEVGLGGRLDATNVCTPVVSVITSLSYDHMFILGNTLAQIATEKCGIIKPGVPVVSAPQVEEARVVIERICTERGSKLIQVGKDIQFATVDHTLKSQRLMVWPYGDTKSALRLEIPLLGFHQAENAAVAFAAIKEYSKYCHSISEQAILDGYSKTFWPGRFEIIQENPPIVLDCAHNRDSARKLRKTLDDYFPGLPVVLVFGASEDKDLEGIFTELTPRVDYIIGTKSFHPRALEPEKILQLASLFNCAAEIVETVDEALVRAKEYAGANSLILVTGSIFVVASAREAWKKFDG